MINPNDYKHIFSTVLPPSVEDNPICGAVLDRDWHGRGKPECPECNRIREQLRKGPSVIPASPHLPVGDADAREEWEIDAAMAERAARDGGGR